MRGLRVGVVVGTILVVINQGGTLLSGQLTSETLWKIFMTYCVPYGVSTYASVSAILSPEDETLPP